MSKRTVIGSITLGEKEVTKRYQTASWFKTLNCSAQTVDLVLSGRWVTYKVEGTVTEEFFPSSFAGNMTGGGNFSKGGTDTDTEVVMIDVKNFVRNLVERPEDYVGVSLFENVAVTIEETTIPDYCAGKEYVASTEASLGMSYKKCDCVAHSGVSNEALGRDKDGFLVGGYKVRDRPYTKYGLTVNEPVSA